jgi:hypothetical protein
MEFMDSKIERKWTCQFNPQIQLSVTQFLPSRLHQNADKARHKIRGL